MKASSEARSGPKVPAQHSFRIRIIGRLARYSIPRSDEDAQHQPEATFDVLPKSPLHHRCV